MDGLRFEERVATRGASLRLSVPPDPQIGRYVRDEVTAFAASLAIPKSDLGDFLSALGEALANAVEHSRVDDAIEVCVWLVGDDRLVGTVVDSGVGFEPEGSGAVEPRLPDALSERGRGIPIMRSCSDLFAVRSEPGRGTAVTIGLTIRSRSAGRLSPAAP